MLETLELFETTGIIETIKIIGIIISIETI